MQDDDARRSRRTRRRADDRQPPPEPAPGEEPRGDGRPRQAPANPQPPTGTMRVRGGPVPRNPGDARSTPQPGAERSAPPPGGERPASGRPPGTVDDGRRAPQPAPGRGSTDGRSAPRRRPADRRSGPPPGAADDRAAAPHGPSDGRAVAPPHGASPGRSAPAQGPPDRRSAPGRDPERPPSHGVSGSVGVPPRAHEEGPYGAPPGTGRFTPPPRPVADGHGAPGAPGPGGPPASAEPGRRVRRDARAEVSQPDRAPTGATPGPGPGTAGGDESVPPRRRRRRADAPADGSAPTCTTRADPQQQPGPERRPDREPDPEPAPEPDGTGDTATPDDGDAGGDRPGSRMPAPRSRAIRIAAAAAAVLVLVTTAFGFVGRGTVHDGVRTVAALAPDADAILDAEQQAGDRNVLVLGVQADRAGVPESARTDTAVLVHQPAGEAQAVTLSVPATLEVSRPPCPRWDPATGEYGETVPAESRTAFATAYDVGGPACSVGVVQQLTGIPVSAFVAFDLAGAPDLIGAVGGIEVCTERPVIDPVLGPVVEGSGTVPLDGPSAVRFASAAGAEDSSPANRVQRQQRVLAGALDDALSAPSLLTPGAPGRAADGLSAAVVADNADAGEILALASGLGRAGTAGDGSTPVFLPVPVSETPNTRGHLELQRSEARTLFSALRSHEPLPPEATAPAARSAPAPAPGTRVDLVDASGGAGVEEMVETLRTRGYEIGTITGGPAADRTEVRYSPEHTDAAGGLVGTLPGARPAPDPAGTDRLELVVGSGDRAPLQAVPASDADCS
ncbi:LCP family protein [Pseudonocardia sp. HH130630-07]|uniref:LCP family protein n=1 Tax=Pseudonocardia sp. HH130630-07 TaxID=1690815 RepID=UPI000814DC65|nr:LCP family protein [Pseudonocardia sp. HH130630-07]ANY06393.1 hypothetical protein AFB00_08930 [Pseudonocardia sp. HH130630-07]